MQLVLYIFYYIFCMYLIFYSVNYYRFSQKNEFTKLPRVSQIALSSKLSSMSVAAWEDKFYVERSWIAR